LQKAADLGVRVVQLADDAQLHRLSDTELTSLRDAADRRGIDLELGLRGIAHDWLLSHLRVAVGLRAPLVRVIIEGTPHPSTAEVVEALRAVVPEYARANVSLAIENHDHWPAASLAAMVEQIDSRHVGICLDTANSIGCAEGLETLLRVLGRWVINLHVKDVRIYRPPHRRGFFVEGCPAGQGQIDIPWVIGELLAQGRNPNAILEQWPPPEATIADSVAKEEAWATESVRYLRKLIPD
jgi:sugar phosphate isomerase/epimerase